jgi:hypothetical protein
MNITDNAQELLNVDALTGNPLMLFSSVSGEAQPHLGARTFAGNDNEWRYASVCLNMVENL